MEQLKYNTVVLDGIDKTGKDLISHYVFELSEKRYLCYARGLMSMIAYNDLFNRPYLYECEKQTGVLNVLLTVKYDDWKIRCKVTNEPSLDFEAHTKAFEKARLELVAAGQFVPIFDTSEYSPYQIAKKIVEIMTKLNREV